MDKSKFNDKNEWRKFATGLSIILLIIASIQWCFDSGLYLYFIFIGGLILLTGLTIPVIIKPIFIGFSYLSLVMNWVMTRIVLIILFYLVFTPIGMIRRLFGKQFLNIKFDKNNKSYWIDRDKEDIVKVNYEKQF